MKRIICLLVAVLGLGISLFAEGMGEATEMTGSVTTRCCADAGHAACDQNCADKSGDVVMVDDQGRVFEIANQDKVKGFAGKESYDSFLKPIEPGGRTFLQPAWNKRSESLLFPMKAISSKSVCLSSLVTDREKR